jgi:hypothetical protein
MSHNFLFGFKIHKYHLLTTPLILVASTWYALLTSRVLLRLARRPSTQFANSTNKIYKQDSTFKYKIRYKVSTFKNALQALECYSPTSSQARVLVVRAIAAYLTRFAVKFFSYDSLNARKRKKSYQRGMYKDNLSRVFNQVFFLVRE